MNKNLFFIRINNEVFIFTAAWTATFGALLILLGLVLLAVRKKPVAYMMMGISTASLLIAAINYYEIMTIADMTLGFGLIIFFLASIASMITSMFLLRCFGINAQVTTCLPDRM